MIGRVELTNKLVAQSTGVAEARVKNVVEFFYKELAQELEECNHNFLYVKNLGTFSMSLRPIEKRLRNIRFMIVHRRSPKFKDSEANQKIIESMVKEAFYLFSLRRRIKKNRLELKKLRNGKSINDPKGKLVQTYREE